MDDLVVGRFFTRNYAGIGVAFEGLLVISFVDIIKTWGVGTGCLHVLQVFGNEVC